MRSRLRFLLLLPIATLIACGESSYPSSGGGNATPVAGDYVITVGVGTASQANFNGNIAVSGKIVSGVFRYNNVSTCVSGAQDIPFTGSVTGNVLTLTSASFSNSVATFTINLPLSNNTNNQQLASGTSVIAGGTCALASSTLQAQFIPSYTGTWTATLTSPSNATATLAIVESATADADGQFPATGVLTFSVSPCSSSTPDSTYTGVVSGATLQLKSSMFANMSITANNAETPVTVSIGGDIGGTNLSACLATYGGTMTD
jgi:multidrug efflux pump subunit AcrA (membrane-fusion protein)